VGSNYYLRTDDAEIHIGKLVSKGTGQGRRFLWAMEPFDLAFMFAMNFDTQVPVESSEGKLTLMELMLTLKTNVEHDYSNVGREFA
jgi:hypothetical protein